MRWIKRAGRHWKFGAFVLLGLFGLMQLVPYGHAHTNPPVTAEPQWDSPATRDLAMRACADCHSNETTWPWYSHVAPFSWLIQHDVDEGRTILNLSEINNTPFGQDHAARAVQNGEMPVNYYTWMHSDAKLSETERQALVDGFIKTFGIGSTPHLAHAGPASQ